MKPRKSPPVSFAEMPVSRPRTKPAEIRRNELMDAAEKLFLEKGVGATSVDEIVAAAGVAKGTFYVHFASRDHLLAALQHRFVMSYADTLQRAMDACRERDWPGRLHAWVAAGVNGYLDRVALHDVVFHEIRVDDRRLKHENVVVERLATFLEEGMQAGAWPVGDARLTAVMLFSALHAAIDDALAEDAPPNRTTLIEVLSRFCRQAIGGG
jgi:AcrR family transcriptional regulator